MYAKLEALSSAGMRIRPTLVSKAKPISFEPEKVVFAIEPEPLLRAEPEPEQGASRPPHPAFQPLEGPELAPEWAASASSAWRSNEPLIERMRRESLYGAFRVLNSVVFGLLVFLGVLAAASGVFALFTGAAAIGLGGISGGLLLIVTALACKQMSLMVADLSDAAVRLAERADRQDRRQAEQILEA